MPTTVISGRCPHCNTDQIAFTWVGERNLAPKRPKDWLTLFSCNKCYSGLVVEYQHQINHGPSSPSGCQGDPADLGFAIVKLYPGPMPSMAPSHVPAPLDRYYLQAADALQSGHSDASGAMSRKVVDVSTQKLLKEASKNYKTIRERIDALATKNLLTPDLKDWAHQVRLGGNDAAHDEDPYTQEEATELLNFVELYLTYVYTMPERLELRRENAAKVKQAEKEKAAAAKLNN